VINTNSLWYSAPSGASHKFYNNGVNTLTIDGSGNTSIIKNVCIGTTTSQSTATLLTISGNSSGYSQPLVQITQNTSWNGNYALQITGYTNCDGLRFRGTDTGNTINQTILNSDLAITQNPSNTTGGNIILYTFGAGGNIKFSTNSTERMKIDSNGNITLNIIITYNNTLPHLIAVKNATTHSMINVFPGINDNKEH
jgi:hypothetical protein